MVEPRRERRPVAAVMATEALVPPPDVARALAVAPDSLLQRAERMAATLASHGVTASAVSTEAVSQPARHLSTTFFESEL